MQPAIAIKANRLKATRERILMGENLFTRSDERTRQALASLPSLQQEAGRKLCEERIHAGMLMPHWCTNHRSPAQSHTTSMMIRI